MWMLERRKGFVKPGVSSEEEGKEGDKAIAVFRQHCRSQADAWVAVSFLVHKSETQHLGRARQWEMISGRRNGSNFEVLRSFILYSVFSLT